MYPYTVTYNCPRISVKDYWTEMVEREIYFIANKNGCLDLKKRCFGGYRKRGCRSRAVHLKRIIEVGSENWKEEVGYSRRWKTETTFSDLRESSATRSGPETGTGQQYSGPIRDRVQYILGCKAVAIEELGNTVACRKAIGRSSPTVKCYAAHHSTLFRTDNRGVHQVKGRRYRQIPELQCLRSQLQDLSGRKGIDNCAPAVPSAQYRP